MDEHISKRRKLTSSLEQDVKPITVTEDEVKARQMKEKNEQTIPSICKRKTTYFEFLVDQPFLIQEEETRLHLMKCLWYALHLQLDSEKNEIRSSIDDDCFEISNVICEVDAAITEHNISLNSEVQLMHLYGQGLIEKNWEKENSVFAKLQQVKNKEATRQYFMMVSTGVEE